MPLSGRGTRGSPSQQTSLQRSTGDRLRPMTPSRTETHPIGAMEKLKCLGMTLTARP
jgi:hypothetical protein